MKNLKFIKNYLNIFFLGLFLVFFSACSANDPEQLPTPVTSTWNEILMKLDLVPETAFVQNGESIQDAVDAALSGDVIYIEPGNYNENLSINKPDIKLIALSYAPNDLSIKNSKENNIEILELYDQKSIDDFLNNRINQNQITDFSRTELSGKIAHYQFKIRVGTGEFDVIRIHRVVREISSYHPVQTKGNVFMVHGAFTGFEGTFLASGLESENDINANTSAPFYLASNDIDVWGIDMGWTAVPDSTTEFSFMDGWGYEKDAEHTLYALRIARLVDGLTEQGFSSLNLLGFSSGNTVAYTTANRETQRSNMMKRHIKGLISVDNAFKIENGGGFGCASAQAVLDQINGGVFQNTNGQFFQTLGFLAHNLPDEHSPIIDDGSTTNIQAFRLVFAMDAFGFGFNFFGGEFGGLFNSDEERATRAVANYSHYMPNQLWYEIDAVNCSSMNVTFDDHIDLISVPILYIGAELGAGVAGQYTSSLTAGNDVTNHIVPGFGHADNFLGNNADQLMWSELRNWIGDHR